jgi:hypothetical protein
MVIRDYPSCGITYERHSDDSRGTIYNRNMFIALKQTFLVSYCLAKIWNLRVVQVYS